MRRLFSIAAYLSLVALPLPFVTSTAEASVPVTLKGSPESMVRQSEVAKRAGYPFVETRRELRERVADGGLVPLLGNDDYAFREGMRSGVARVEMRLFVERLAEQYHEATGERLVVTSLTRPKSRQPSNSHALSVHPAGIAVDLRVSARQASRQWLESTLLSLERRGVLDVTRERWPPHYHVALFPEPYLTHVEQMIGTTALTAALSDGQPAALSGGQQAEQELPPPGPDLKGYEGDAPAGEEERGAWAVLWALPAVVAAATFLRWRRRP